MFRPLVAIFRELSARIQIYLECVGLSLQNMEYIRLKGSFETFMVMKTLPAAEENI